MTLKINCNYIGTFAINYFIRLFLVNRLGIKRQILISFSLLVISILLFEIQKFGGSNMWKCSNSMATLPAVLYNTYILLFTALLNALRYYVDLLI